MADDVVDGNAVKSLLNKTATSRESETAAAILLGELVKTDKLVMAQNHTAEAAPKGSQPPNAAGAVDPLAR